MGINVAKDIDKIREELFKHIESVQDEYVKNGWLPSQINLNSGVIRGLLEVFIYGIFQLYQLLNILLKQAAPVTSSGEWLEMHADAVDLKRKKATKAEGTVTFTRTPSFTGNIRVPAGKIIKTPVDAYGKVYRYITSEDVILRSGQDAADVPVVSEEYGRGANASAGIIRELVTPIQNIASVTNTAGWLTREGADEETDAQLLERYKLRWRSQAGVTSAAYAFAALSVEGVASVKIFDLHPRGQGTVDIVVLGTGGEPTDKLLKDVESAVASEIIINDNVLVCKADAKEVRISVKIEYLSGNESELKSKSESFIRQRLAELSKTIGRDMILARVVSDVVNLVGIKRVVWIEPETDLEVSPHQFFKLKNLKIEMVKVEDE